MNKTDDIKLFINHILDFIDHNKNNGFITGNTTIDDFSIFLKDEIPKYLSIVEEIDKHVKEVAL